MDFEACYLALVDDVLAKVCLAHLGSLDVYQLHGDLVWSRQAQDLEVVGVATIQVRRSSILSPLGLWEGNGRLILPKEAVCPRERAAVRLLHLDDFCLNGCVGQAGHGVELGVSAVLHVSHEAVAVLDVKEGD